MPSLASFVSSVARSSPFLSPLIGALSTVCATFAAGVHGSCARLAIFLSLARTLGLRRHNIGSTSDKRRYMARWSVQFNAFWRGFRSRASFRRCNAASFGSVFSSCVSGTLLTVCVPGQTFPLSLHSPFITIAVPRLLRIHMVYPHLIFSQLSPLTLCTSHLLAQTLFACFSALVTCTRAVSCAPHLHIPHDRFELLLALLDLRRIITIADFRTLGALLPYGLVSV